MFSTLKQKLKFRITHLIYSVATTKYEARTWTKTTLCPNCQQLIPIDAHFCMHCGYQMVASSSTSIEERIVPSPPPDEMIFAPDIQLQDTEPISIDEINALLSSSEYQTRRFLTYVRSYNGQQISQIAMLHRQRQDTENIVKISN